MDRSLHHEPRLGSSGTDGRAAFEGTRRPPSGGLGPDETWQDGAGVRPRVLVADDSPPMRLLLRTLLTAVARVDVVGEVGTGAEALAFLAESPRLPEIALLDVNMPGVDGAAAAEVIATYFPDVDVVLHTADPYSEAADRARRLPFPLVDKIELDELITRVGASRPCEPRSGRTLDRLVLAALALGATDAVVVVLADGSVPFYSNPAARLLGLPFPAPADMSLRTVLAALDVRDLDGGPVRADEVATSRALREHRPVTADELVRTGDARSIAVRVRALPFFDDDGVLLGVATSLAPVPDGAAEAAADRALAGRGA